MNARPLLFLVLAGLLGACASDGPTRLPGRDEAQDYVVYAGEPVSGFSSRSIDDWTSVSETQLVVWTGVNQAWLLTVRGQCRELRRATRIGVSSTAGRVTRFDRILVDGVPCLIDEIRPVDVRQLKADRARERELFEGDREPRAVEDPDDRPGSKSRAGRDRGP